MYKDLWRQRPLLTLPQIIILLLVGAALFIAVDLNRRAQAGQLVGVGEGDLQIEVDAESTRSSRVRSTLWNMCKVMITLLPTPAMKAGIYCLAKNGWFLWL